MRAPRRGDVGAQQTTKKGLLILVNFKDKKFYNTSDKTKEIFSQMVNAIGKPYGKNHGSVREYFRDQSYQQLDIEFDVVGPVTVSQNMKYYGQNVNAFGQPDDEGEADAHAEDMVKEAIALVDEEVNFADYDWDGDGEVENIYVTYAGFGEAVSGADPNTIWPHQWQFSEAYGSPITVDGVKVDTYACGSELAGTSGHTIEGIGTMCHEYSHCLGLPDFYDVKYSGAIDMADWSLMSDGCNNDEGHTPCGYTAYERWFCGWLEPQVLQQPVTITDMPCISDQPVAYVIYNDNNRNEYYLLANHQQKAWDAEIAGHGMMILHVDYDSEAWAANTVNTIANHPRMAIIPADNVLYKSDDYYWGDAGDLWPGTKNKTALTDSSTPAAKLYNKNTDGTKLMHKSIEDIAENGGLISFNFMGGKALIDAPVALDATDITPTTFTANWQAVDAAQSYEVTLTTVYDDGTQDPTEEVNEAITMIEDFDAFYCDLSATADGSTDLGAQLDQYTNFPGWTGSCIYQGLYGAKLGTGSKTGHLTTPLIECTTGSVSVFIDAFDWFNSSTHKEDGSTLDVILQDANGNELQRQNVTPGDLELLISYEYPNIVVNFNDAPAQYKICLSTTAPKKRIYLEYFIAFDGTFTVDQITPLFDEEDYEDGEDYDYEDYEPTQAPRRRRHAPLSAPFSVSSGSVAALSAAPFSVSSGSVAAPLSAPRRKPVTTTATVTDIHELSYTFSDLTPGVTCTYRVRAVDAQGNKSAWSNPITFTLPLNDADDITTPHIVNNKAVNGKWYNLSGQPITTPRGITIRDGKKYYIK